MKILFRCDSSSTIGIGHLVRCLTLAETLKHRGHEIHFYAKDLPGNANELILKQGFTLFDQAPHSPYEIAFIDHYKIFEAEEKDFKRFAKKVIVIDDFGVRKHQADLILDPSLSPESELRQKQNAPTPFFGGLEYLLLRPEFKTLHQTTQARTGFKKVLMFFGGTDPEDQTVAYLNAVIKMNPLLSHFEFHFLMTQAHPRKEDLIGRVCPTNIKFHISPPSVANLMRDCDLYVGSGGTVTWERMCLGLTGIVVSVVDNQEAIASHLEQKKLHFYGGRSATTAPETVLNLLLKITQNPTSLTEYSKRCLDAVDGRGTERFADVLESFTLTPKKVPC